MNRPGPRIPAVLCVVVATAAAAPVTATVWPVTPEIAGDLQGVSDLAAPGDTVLLAPGTYFEHVTVANKHLVFRSEAGSGATVLDGGQTGRILLLENAGGTVTVAGLTFRNGALAGLEASDGAAILARNTPLQVEDCTFTANRLLTPGRGGAIFTTFFAPTAAPGPPSLPPPPGLTVSRCRFENNVSGDEGGAVACDEVASEFIDCVFIGNTAVLGGAVSLLRETCSLVRCRFEGNRAALHGGALMSSGVSTLFLDEVLFRENRAEDYGGALRAMGGAGLQLTRTWFVSNTGLRGAALDATTTPVIADRVLFYGGTSDQQAAGVYLDGATAGFTRCTWLQNRAPFGASLVARAVDLSVTGSLLGDDDPQATECLAGSTVSAGCNAGAPSTGDCVDVAARITVAGCPSEPEALCALPEVGGCGIVGHAETACSPGSCDTPVLPTTWGRLKTAYR